MQSPQSGVPSHVAIVMDGNGRWASQRFLPRSVGHQAGVKAVRKTVEACLNRNIGVLTLFAFSSENWRRPTQEVNLLLELFLLTLDQETEALHTNGVRLLIIGDRSAFSQALQDKIALAEGMTCHNNRLTLVIAINYGGRWDICQAMRQIAQKVSQCEVQADEITEEMIAAHLSLAAYPAPDLFIRTGGEQRISNFLLWQMAYSEFHFTQTLWPDFDEKAFGDALADYANRQRRFGRTGEQLKTPDS